MQWPVEFSIAASSRTGGQGGAVVGCLGMTSWAGQWAAAGPTVPAVPRSPRKAERLLLAN
jgi:hypothetical protein